MNLSEISYLCGGRLKTEGRLEIEKFVIDSRRAEKNSLFFCINGEKVDGHDFMGEAKSRGAYVVGEKGNCDIIVDSSVDALIKAASRYRRKINARVIGITGSAGKTSTVSLVKSVLSNKYRVCSTPASFNTRIGVSIALLNFTEKCQMAVVEMGANSRGEIKEICEIALPQTGLITNISDAHIGVFGSRENIIKAKFELADAIPQKGCFIYNSDDDNLYQKAKSYKIPKMSFSLDSEADIKGRIISRTQEGIAFKCQGQIFKIKVPGIFN
ncbi:MAG: UDP-N-acetylmuramoyl-tripeptide--D-alanyl-D-alanine ligase, partial [Elusimicrobiota bacterium]